MASKRMMQNVTPFKVAFNGVVFPPGVKVCIPNDWDEVVVKAGLGKLLNMSVVEKPEPVVVPIVVPIPEPVVEASSVQDEPDTSDPLGPSSRRRR